MQSYVLKNEQLLIFCAKNKHLADKVRRGRRFLHIYLINSDLGYVQLTANLSLKTQVSQQKRIG